MAGNVNLDHVSIANSLMDATVDRLRLKLREEQDDQARAGLVRAGKLQADPTDKKVNVLIHPGGEEWPDILNTDTGESAGMYVPATYEIGGLYGGTFWRRRFRVELSIFFSNETSRDNSRQKALVVLHRAHNALLTWDVGREVGRDDFGEHAYALQVTKMNIREGGGDGDFNWRGDLWLEFLTSIEPREI